MAIKRLKEIRNTGFGNNTENIGNRLIQKNGTTNTVKKGQSFLQNISAFHTLLKMSWFQFIGFTFIAFILINVLFTFAYFWVGINNLTGIETQDFYNKLLKTFFFSIQTFTTVGYGHISPSNTATSAISGIEAFFGLLFFALVTGLMYARFSKPNAFVKFSYNAVIAPYEKGTALMFRLVPYKNNHLTDAEIKLSLALIEDVDGKKRTEFYVPKMEIATINSLVLSWTIVHPIDEESPLYGLSFKEILETKIELLVFLKAFDETYSTTVVARTSYLYNEIIWGQKFIPMYQRSENAQSTKIQLSKLNEMLPIEMPNI